MTDREILDLFHSGGGRERAFTLLVERYQQRVYFHIRRMVKSHDDANDIMQNTFIKVWNALENFRSDSQLFTWLYRIATNETITFLNSKTRHSTVAFEGGEEDETYSPSAFVQGESNPVDADKIQRRLQMAIDTLPEKQKIVFNMRYYDEMPYEQMSEILDTSVGALKASYHHAAQKIEKYLLGEE